MIAHAMTMGAYERRAGDQRMTGEWIIFEPGPTGNYYLTLSTHEGETDEERRARVEAYREVDTRLAAESRPLNQSDGFEGPVPGPTRIDARAGEF